MARSKKATISKILHTLCLAIAVISTLSVAVYFSYYRYKLGLVRFFDSDELAYLSWTAHLLAGYVPYKDFLFFLTPGYLFFLIPSFIGVGHSETIFETARFSSWIVSLGAALAVTLVAWQYRRRGWTALIAGLLFLFIPLPSNKVIEIRPDTLCFFFVMLGVAVQLGWMDAILGRQTIDRIFLRKISKRVFFSGMLYGLGIFIAQKALVPVACAWLLTVLFAGSVSGGSLGIRFRHTAYLVIVFSIGLLVFPGILLVWAATMGKIDDVIYILTKFPIEQSVIFRRYYIPPEFFFYPTDVVYGVYGEHIGYIASTLIWTFGIGMGVFRFFTPFAVTVRARYFREILLPVLLLAQLFSYLYFVPAHHSQYLIPIVMFVVVFVADAFGSLWRIVSRNIFATISFTGIWILLLLILIKGFSIVFLTQINWRNTITVSEFSKIQTAIPTTEPILDLVGLTMFHPYPYYVCCNPFKQWDGALSRPLPSTMPALEKVNYIYQGWGRLVSMFSGEEAEYIRDNFEPIGQGTLLKRKTIPIPAGLE